EAASRSLKEPTAENLNDLVDKIVESKLEQKQLSESNITLGDITTISEIFKDMLKSIYHVRIDYDVKKGKKPVEGAVAGAGAAGETARAGAAARGAGDAGGAASAAVARGTEGEGEAAWNRPSLE